MFFASEHVLHKEGVDMTRGPDQIIACPKCNNLAWHMTLASCNTFGERVWTDGKRVFPYFPRLPEVVKCRNCAECYWLAEAAVIGTIDRWRSEGQQVNPAWEDAEEVQEPAEKEYYEAIDKEMATSAEQEFTLRVLAWWRRNDAFRDSSQEQNQGVSSVQGPWRKSLEALELLLSEKDDSYLLLQAEVLRELGKFESAKQVLSSVDSPNVAAAVFQFQSLCDTRDTCVREMNFSA